MISTLARCALLFGFLAVAIHSQASDPQMPLLRFDPFHKQPGPEKSSSSTSAQDSDWQAELTAVLVSGDDSLANLGGVILRVGEETNGYTLVEVQEFSAVFERGGQRVTLTVEREEN